MRNVLLLSSGSKVALARIARRSARKRGLVLHAADRSENVPTSQFVDSFYTLESDNWIEALIRYCRKSNIGLIIPTRHEDLLPLANARNEFDQAGIVVSISSLETIELCIDKRRTAAFLEEHGFPAPQTFSSADFDTAQLTQRLPLISKPISGSSSKGIRILRYATELSSLPLDSNTLLQTLATGDEYTINVYVAKSGRCLCAIPHRRLIVDGGESVQAITERNEPLIELAHSISEALPGAWGLLNIQAFYDTATGSAQVIEINPRIGGAFPLADQAKGSYIEWLHEEVFESRTLEPFSAWTDQLRMMRYRDAIFDFPRKTLCNSQPPTL